MPSPIKFTVQDIQPIMESMIRFVNSIDAYQGAIQYINQNITKPDTTYFKVLVNDGLKRKDKKHHSKTDFRIDTGINNSMLKSILSSGRKTLTPTPSPRCRHISADYFGIRVFMFPTPKNQAKNCRAVYNDNLIFQSNIKTDKSLEEYLMENPIVMGDLVQKASWAIGYYRQKPNMYQKDMDAHLVNMEKISLISKTQTIRNIPFMQTIEHLRQFLFDVLITHHTPQIALTPEDARQHLKANKDDIFTKAEQFGYIPDAQKMIKYQNLRDQLAHPDDLHFIGGPQLPENCSEIISDFEGILTSLLQGDNIKILAVDAEKNTDLVQKSLVQLPDENLFNNVNAYQLINQLDTAQTLLGSYTLPTRTNGKPLTGRKKLEALNTLGVLSQNDVTKLEEVTLTRNGFAHGSLCAIDSEQLQTANRKTHAVLQHIVQHQKDRHQFTR